MTAVPVRLRATAVLVAVTAMVALTADAAFAGSAMMKPTVKGYGTVSATGYACSNFSRDDRVVVTSCGTNIVGAPLFGNALITMVAEPFTATGNTFAGWQDCTVPLGALGSAVASGTVCSLSVSWLSSDILITPRAVFDDVAGPEVSTVAPVYSTSTDRGASFAVTASEPASAFECSVDSGAFASCASVRQLGEGTHTVRARATDLSGNVGALSTASSFRIIDTQLVSGPADFSAVKRPSFTYSSLAGVRFECSVDSVLISTACGEKDPATGRASFTPPADLADGVHTFRVEAIDGDAFDRVPVVRTWRVDTTAPVVTGLASPTVLDGIVTTARDATFTWDATEVGGMDRFDCSVDGSAFAPCASPKALTGLPAGERTFAVRGVDRAGNTGAPVSRSWTVAARDSDGDGFDERSDCDESNPRINPNATDAPGNGVDENCDGADAAAQQPLPAAAGPAPATGGGASTTPAVNPALLGAKGTARGTRTVFTRLLARRVPVGATIVATCKAGRRGSCPFKAKRVTAKKATVDLIAAFAARRRGKPGTSLTFRFPATLKVTVSARGLPAKTLSFTLAKGKFPKSKPL